MEKFRKRRAFGVAALGNRVALRRVKINRQNAKIGVFFDFFFDGSVANFKIGDIDKAENLPRALSKAARLFAIRT